MDKTNLIKKVAELDETVKTLAKQYTQQRVPQISKIKACYLMSYHFINCNVYFLSYVPLVILVGRIEAL